MCLPPPDDQFHAGVRRLHSDEYRVVGKLEMTNLRPLWIIPT